jgi:hypothetical protein
LKYSWIAVFFCAFLFTRIFPTLIISNAVLGTEAEKVGKLSPLFFSTPRNSLVCWAQRRINEYLHVRRRRWYGKARGKTFSC